MSDHHRDVSQRRFGVLWPECDCGWLARMPRARTIAAQLAHCQHLLVDVGTLNPQPPPVEPPHYKLCWEEYREERWLPRWESSPDGSIIVWKARVLDNLPSLVRNVAATNPEGERIA